MMRLHLSPKTTQNEFKGQHNVDKQRDVSHFRIALYGQVIQSEDTGG